MNTQKLVFVTPLDDREVEVDTDELCAAGEPPHRVAGGLVEAARFVAVSYTHLDVYKRQVPLKVMAMSARRPAGPRRFLTTTIWAA